MATDASAFDQIVAGTSEDTGGTPALSESQADDAAQSAEQSEPQDEATELRAQVAQLKKENRALQSAKDRETSAERQARERAERRLLEMEERLESIESDSVQLREQSIDNMGADELREYIRTNYRRGSEAQQRASLGARLFNEANEAVDKLNVTDEEWAEYFDSRLASERTWITKPDDAKQVFRENVAAVKAARNAAERERKKLSEDAKKKAADDEHAERDALAVKGAYSADRSRGAAKGAPPSLRDLQRMSMDEYLKHRDGYLAALKDIPADSQRGQR